MKKVSDLLQQYKSPNAPPSRPRHQSRPPVQSAPRPFDKDKIPAPSPIEFLVAWADGSARFGAAGTRPSYLAGNVLRMLFAGGYGDAWTDTKRGRVRVHPPASQSEWIQHLAKHGYGSRAVRYRAVRLMKSLGFIEYAAAHQGCNRDLARRRFVERMLAAPSVNRKGMAFLRAVVSVYYSAMPSNKDGTGLKARIKSPAWFCSLARVCRRFAKQSVNLLSDVSDSHQILIPPL